MFLNSTVNINSVLLLNLDRKRASDYLIQRKDKASKIERSSLQVFLVHHSTEIVSG